MSKCIHSVYDVQTISGYSNIEGLSWKVDLDWAEWSAA
jgi:hypothetical protein